MIFLRAPLIRITATALSLCLIAGTAFAQSSNDGWQDLGSYPPESAADSVTEPLPENDGWRDLNDYEGRAVSQETQPKDTSEWRDIDPPQSPLSGPTDSDGWQEIYTPLEGTDLPPETPNPSEGWRDVDTDWQDVSAQPSIVIGTLAAGDLIEIAVKGSDNIDGTYRISTLGTLFLPLIGSVDVAGYTAEGLEAELERLYEADYLVDPEITVTMREKVLGDVVISGLINRGGTVSLAASDNLLSVLTKAGGVNGSRAEMDAIILRKLGDTLKARRVALGELTQEQLSGPPLFPGDRISVLRREKLPEIKDASGQYPLLDKVLSGGTLRNF